MLMAGNGLGFWNTIPMSRRASVSRRSGLVDVVAVEQDLAGERGGRHELVHPVEDAQERRLAAAGRPDEGGDLPGGMVSETRSRTWWLPNQAERSRASSSASVAGAKDGATARCASVGPRRAVGRDRRRTSPPGTASSASTDLRSARVVEHGGQDHCRAGRTRARPGRDPSSARASQCS